MFRCGTVAIISRGHPEDGDSKALRNNVGTLPHHYSASQSRKPGLESSQS